MCLCLIPHIFINSKIWFVGSTLECDCRIRWIAEWVQDRDLQVTSRERNPQFCGNPEHLRRRNFYQILSTDLMCDGETSTIKTPTKRPKRLNSEFEDTPNDVRESGDKVVQIVTLDTQVDITGTTRGNHLYAGLLWFNQNVATILFYSPYKKKHLKRKFQMRI